VNLQARRHGSSRRIRGQTPDTALAAASLLVIAATVLAFAAGSAPGARGSAFDQERAFALLKEQVELGPRPAGSAASRALAARLRTLLPSGRFQAVPGGLRNVIGVVPGRNPRRTVVVGAHYDTKDLPGFLGANDGASGTAVAVQLARTVRKRELRPTVVFVLFDGEESPPGAPENQFERYGLRGSKVAAKTFKRTEAMILLDFVGDKDLSTPRESLSNKRLWAKLRTAAARTGHAAFFPPRASGAVLDDHVPFLRRGIPAIDLIDFDFPCWHERCDDMTAVSAGSLDVTGETVLELLRSL
jgi:Peptidase family M28